MSFSRLHPFFVGVTDIAIKPNKKQFQVTLKVFTEDLQNAILHQQQVKFIADNVSAQNKLALYSYLKPRLTIGLVAGKKTQWVPLKLLGWENQEEATYCYLEGTLNSILPIPQNFKCIIQNKVLYDELDKQVHLVHVTYNGNRKSEQLSYPNFRLEVSFP